jgi:hypothetical protein
MTYGKQELASLSCAANYVICTTACNPTLLQDRVLHSWLCHVTIQQCNYRHVYWVYEYVLQSAGWPVHLNVLLNIFHTKFTNFLFSLSPGAWFLRISTQNGIPHNFIKCYFMNKTHEVHKLIREVNTQQTAHPRHESLSTVYSESKKAYKNYVCRWHIINKDRDKSEASRSSHIYQLPILNLFNSGTSLNKTNYILSSVKSSRYNNI